MKGKIMFYRLELEGAQRVHISAKCCTNHNQPVTNPSLLPQQSFSMLLWRYLF